MNHALFPNKESYHTIIILGNVDDKFDVNDFKHSELSDKVNIHFTKGINDLLMIGTADIYSAINQISQLPGLFSSRTLILTDETLRRVQKSARYSGILMIEPRYGADNEVADQLSHIKDIYAIYKTQGIYGIVALVSFENETTLKNEINAVQHIRHASLSLTEDSIKPVEVKKEPQIISARHYNTRNKKEGENYQTNVEINTDYIRGCIRMAERFLEIQSTQSGISMIYAPLRGAKPILEVTLEALREMQIEQDYFFPEINFPVTSSFVSYQPCHRYTTKKGKKPASGRTTNILELRRLARRSPQCTTQMLYIDEIVSGGMMVGHVNEMINSSSNRERRGIFCDYVHRGEFTLHVFGLAHAFGSKLGRKKEKTLLDLQKKNIIRFNKFSIQNLITEDQRFLLGQHYLLNTFGPHVIPFINETRDYHPEYHAFWSDVRRAVKNI